MYRLCTIIIKKSRYLPSMKTLTKIVLFVFLVCTQKMVAAQTDNFLSLSQIGVFGGGSYYIGDLNQFNHFKNTNLSLGFIYRFHLNSRLAVRGTFTYGRVEAYDAQSTNPTHQIRNLSFQSDILELAGGIEFNFLNYQIGNDRFFWTPYLFIEAAVFHMNPTTEYNGQKVELRSVGTEGQGSNLSSEKSYPLFQLAIPFGLGFKINLGNRMAVSFEYGIRKTFTDYLDDVGGADYINPSQLAAQNGNIAAALSDRSEGNTNLTGTRGNPKTKDWYSMFGVMLTFTLGNPDNCYYFNGY